MGRYALRYAGEYCFIPAKESVVNNCEALVLAPDYRLEICSMARTRNNYYPVRPYRTSYYKYR